MKEHPISLGFKPRYEWHGKEQHIVWTCCGRDALQGQKQIIENGRVIRTDFAHCPVCGRKWERDNRHLYEQAAQ